MLIAALELRAPLAVDPASTIPFLAACSPLAAIALFYGRVRPNENLALMATTLLQVLLFSALGSILQYLLAREGGQLWNPELTRWDRSLGIEWTALVRTVDRLPAAAFALKIAYKSLIPQVVVLVVLLGLGGRRDLLRAYMLAGMLCGASCILLSTMFPAVASYVHLGLRARDYPNLDLDLSYAAAAELDALRAGRLMLIRLPDMQGIVTFPSYHAGLATVNLWAFLNGGRSKARILGAIAALGTIVSAPIHGGHYVVDVLAGIAIGTASILAACRLIYWRAARLRLRGWSLRPLPDAWVER